MTSLEDSSPPIVLKAGWHVAKPNLYSNLRAVYENGGRAAQVYMSNKQRWMTGKAMSEAEVAQILAFRREKGFYIVCHGKLLLNLCHNEITGPQVMPALIADMQAADRIGADVVVHQGKNIPELGLSREEALTRFVLNLQIAIDSTPELTNRILLENSCQQGTEMGHALSELAMIWRILEPEYRTRIGFCLDTCHAHVGGMMNLANPAHVTTVFEEFDRTIGLEHLRLIHFNDSEIRFDGHNDSHADILVGYGGNPGLGGTTQGLRRVVQIACKHNIPLILETPGKVPIQSQLQLILGWAGQGHDIEGEYVVKYETHIQAFSSDPCSRKGRSKKKNTEEKENPVLPQTPSQVPHNTIITPMIKRLPKLVVPLRKIPLLPPLPLLPRTAVASSSVASDSVPYTAK